MLVGRAGSWNQGLLPDSVGTRMAAETLRWLGQGATWRLRSMV